MSAVFTGNGLGLFNTSLTQLGAGLGGGAGVGQGRDSQYVNVATGNLVWQSGDEHLVFRGLAIGLTRTYNSRGQVSDVGADGWMTGFERKVALQSGTFNASGSVMRRMTGDGSYQDFTWVSANTYRSTSGDGAHDTLTWTGSSWRYVEGSTRREEGYANHADATAQGRLTYLRELRSDGTTPVTWQVVYDANQRIAELRADDGTGTGDALLFAYDGSGRLSSVSTREAGTVRLQVSYGYDGQGRLASVLTDLTPGNTGDNTWDATTLANNNGRLFRTEYTYEGTSLRLASVRQSDGTLISYTYHADGRLKTITRGDTNTNDADGVGETVTYTYGAGSTTVTDSLGRAWVYAFDANGQLISLTAPAISGQSDITTYQYDASGNVTQVKTVRGAAVLSLLDYAYDASGNVTWEWDGLGNAISRTWSASNQLLSLTRYTGVDPDRTGAGLPTGGMTTRYIYDAQDRVRFVVEALGQVSEFTYATSGNGIGQQSSLRQYLGAGYTGTYDLASLQAWATATQKASSQLSELAYDAWGRLSQRTDYATVNGSGVGVLDAGTGITRYTYDAQGTLRQQVTLRGAGRTVGGAAQTGSEQVDYVYDGMGRLLSATLRQVGVSDSDATTIQTSYAYLDSGHQVAVTDDAGKITVQTRDAAGRVVSVSAQGVVGGSPQTRTQVNYYDATGQLRASEDAGGGRTYYFYDAKGRLAATVDATGAVSRITYDGADRVLSTRQYANRVTTTDWVVAGKVVPTTVTTTDNNTLDRVTGRTYDAAGRLLTETDGLASSADRTITTYTYDAAGRVLQARTTDSVGTAGTARTVRYFYDEAGRTIGQLDAAGYLTETQYDRAGRVLVQIRYATVSPSAHWASGTLVQLRPSTNPAQDQTTRYYYDGRGRQVGVLDAQGYLTEWVFDEAGNARAERRYATALTWAGGDTLASLRSRAGTYREQRMAYNALGQLATQTNAEGTVTRFTYDEAGRLVKTEVAQGTSEVREGHLRYNVFGELIGELGGESAPQVLPGMTETQLDAVYAQYGVRHGYDVLGRRIESIDAAGNRTWYFYDAAGRNTFTVRGVADGSGVANAQGEVTETRYTAFGDVSDQIAYTGRITLAVPGSRASAQAAVSVLAYSSSVDTRRQFTYTARGQLATIIDAVSAQTRYSYDAFGQLQQQVQAHGTAAAVTLQYQYDARGLRTGMIEGVGAGTTIERSQAQTYDAFGRVTSVTDARGAVRSFTYDRLGRQLTVTQMVQGRTETTATVYDAHGRVVSVTDAEGQVTSYVHSDAARSLTVTSPEGVVVTTLHNRHGQTVQVTDPAGRTEYTYDRNGSLTKTERKAGDGTVVTSETRQYDTTRGLLTAVVDGSGRRVEYQYDATGRVLRRTQDPAGMALVTTYAYDGQGRQLSVTDPSGRVVGYKYDREGRLTEVSQDPASLNMRTQYTYDVQGRQVSVIEGAGTSAARTTQYAYDVLGRRISEVVDPGAGKLNLTTSYAYDKNDNVIRRTDANGQVTRYYYDEANRQVYAIDPLGAMTRQWYDRVGQVVTVRSFSQPTNAATLNDTDTISQVDARLAWLDADRGEYRVYDKDGRVRFVLDKGGSLTEQRYDAAGRLVATRAYANAYNAGALLDGLFAGTTEPSQIVPTADDLRDERTFYVRDASGQVRLVVDGLGNVRQLQYDAAGRLVGSIAYAQPAALTTPLRNQLLAGTATVVGVLATVTANAAKDLVEHQVHDAAGRLRYTIDAIGAVRETLYDASGLEVGARAYATVVTVDATLRSRLQAGTATVGEVGALLTPTIVNDVRNLEQFQVRDAAGRVRLTIDVLRDASGNATGLISELRYDQAGRLIERLEREGAVATATLTPELPALRAGTANVTTVAGWVSGSTTRYTAWVYDAAGRARYTLQADSSTTRTVREQRYDAAGQVVAEIAYAVTIPSGTARTLAAVATAITTAGGDAAAQQRVTTLVRDAAGQVRFRMDDAGAVTELRYDGLGRVVQSRQYAQLVSTSTAQTEVAMAGAVAGQSGSNVRVTQTAYNAAGRVASVTDAAGKVESYGYDAIGRRTSLTNKLGHVWTYAYDAAGRLVEETSPQVTVATSTIAGAVTTATRSVKTVIAYDALGNVVSRTEDATGAQPRITHYQYDSRGNQVRTIFPDAWQINGDGQLVATGTAPSIEVTYNALGQAVVQKDVRGNYTYKVYDSVGRVAYEVDPEGHVSGYKYNSLDEQTELRRYATKLNFGGIAGFVAGNALSLSQMTGTVVVASAANDRILTTTYDRRGLKTQVTQSAITYVKADGATASASPTTQFTYNVFGELVRTSVLLDASTNLWAHSWQYYDELGRNTLSVDAEGYVTQTQYNALGEVVQVKEYARALSAAVQAGLTVQAPPPPPAAGEAAIGYDRVVSYSYDAMGRKASESVLRHYGRTDGSQGIRPVATQWTYDAAGQVTVTDVDGQQTRTTYDALGRVVAVQEAAQQRLASTAEAQLLDTTNIGLGTQSLYVQVSGYTALAYDAFGNAVRTIRYANGKVGESAPVADAANDQVSIVAYDRQGRAVMSQDAQENRVYLQYDAADNIVHSWYTLKIGSGADKTVHSYYTYDAAGRQLTSRTERSGEAAPDQLDVVRYNAFGEIVAKGNHLTVLPAEYQYDKVGNLVRSNAEGGAWRDYGYNLAGHQVRESHSVYVGPGNVTAVTRYVTDRLGRTIAMVLPSHTQDVGQVNYLSQKVDRWGNVIELVDPRGYQTTYQYNDRDQLVREIRPLVKVVTRASQDANWQRPELTWSYDELGRLVASRDGNGNTTRYEYDGTGKQVKVIDANGSVTLTAYDALGRARITQNAMGYLTWKQYDRLDQVTAHGDYLPSSSGTTRAKKTLESYVLNQNGQRVQVANALGKITKYDYDSRGLLVRSQTPMGVVMVYGYDLGGRRSWESYASMPGHPTVLDRDGETVKKFERTWDYDYFGGLIDRNDLDGNDYDYTYDTASGQLKTETNSLGLNRVTLYNANGLVREIQEPNGVVYRYEYDAAGNRIMEYAEVKDSRGKQYKVRTDIVYDSHNRLLRVTQDDMTVVGGKRVFELSYGYDAAGNRTRVVARTGYGDGAPIIDASNAPPTVIGLPTSRTIRAGVATEFRVRLSDLFRDPEGKSLSVTAVQVAGSETALPSWLSYSIDANTGEAVFLASTGSSAANGQTLILRLKASDPSGGTAAVDFSLTVRTNSAPVANPAGPSSIPVRIGQPWIGELNVWDYFTDEDVGDVMTLSLVGISPAAGWLTIDTSNPGQIRLTGTPGAGHAGTYAVTLRATDQAGGATTRVVNLVVSANQAPQVVAVPGEQQAGIGRQFLMEVPVNGVFQDPDGDPLSIAAILANGDALPPWLSFSVVEGSPTLIRIQGHVPTSAVNGTRLTIRLVASDGAGATAQAQFDLVLLSNLPPVLNHPLANHTVGRNTPFSYQIPETAFSDPEGYFLSYSASGLPGGVSFNATTRTFSGSPQTLGSHVITVTASDGQGGTRSTTFTLAVTNSAPTAPTIPNQTATAGTGWSYQFPAFTDPNGDPLTYSVTGMPGWMGFNQGTRTLSGTPGPVGSWTLTVTAQDPSGATVSGTLVVSTPNAAPTAATIPTQSLPRNISGSFSVASYFSDANGDALTFSATGLPAGLSISSAGLISGTPTAALGNYTVTATANDGRGGSVSRSFTLTLANSVPTAPTIPDQTATAGTGWSYQLPAFTDPNGDPLTYTVTGMPGWMNFNDGSRTLSGTPGPVGSWTITVTARDPSNASVSRSFTVSTPNVAPTASTPPNQSLARNISGSFSVAAYFSDANGDALTFSATGLPTGLSISGAGVISGTPTAALGNYSVTVTANDGRGGTVSRSFTLTVANSAPTAPTIPNQTATAGTGWSYQFPAFTDPNGDPLAYTVSGMPGWMGFNAGTRTVSGTPGPVGSWTLTVTAQDPSGASVSQSFAVTTPNVAPVVANGIGNHSVGRNMSWTFQVPANTFSDANGDTLSYSASGMPSGLNFNASTRTFSGAPATLGNHTITVTVSDGNGGTRSTSFTLSVTNNPPNYNGGLVNRSATEGAAVNWALPGGAFTDPNGDGLSYTLLIERPGYYRNVYGEAPPGEQPPLLPDPVWVPAEWHPASWYGLSINGSTGTITGTANPIALPDGPLMGAWNYRVKIVASDGIASTEGIFDLNINSAPTGYIPNQTINSSTGWSYQVPAFFDLNGDTLSYSASGLPGGLSFNPGTRTISGSVASGGQYTITITANDGNGGVGSASFTLTVLGNNAPIAPSIPNQSATMGQGWSYQVPAFTDPNGDPLSYSISGLPGGLSFNSGNRTISGTPNAAGSYTVTVTANDGRGGITSASFNITVVNVPVNQPPVVQHSIPTQTAQAYTWWSYTFPASTFADPNGDPLTYTAEGMPLGTFLDSATRTFSGFMPWTQFGDWFAITVTASDGKGGQASTSFGLQLNPPPGGPGGPIDPEIPPLGGPLQTFSQGFLEEGGSSGLDGVTGGSYLPMSGGGTHTQEAWYAYDKLNRVSVVNGVLDLNGQVVVANNWQSYGLTYDAAGNQVSRYFWSNGVLSSVNQQYNLRGQLIAEFGVDPPPPGALPGLGVSGVVETRAYDDAGRVTEVRRFYPAGTKLWLFSGGGWAEHNVSGGLKSVETTTYDDDGRVLTIINRSREEHYAPPHNQPILEIPPLLDIDLWDETLLTVTTQVKYTGAPNLGYDEAGRVKGYTYTTSAYTHTYLYTSYVGRDTYLESEIKGSSSNTSYKLTTSTMTYDAAGRQTEIREHTEYASGIDDRVRSFALDGNGMILARRDGTVTSGNVFQQKNPQGQTATGDVLGRMNQTYVYASGQQVASLDGAGKLDVLSRLTAFSNTEAGKTQVVVLAGEKLRDVAQRVYGNANLWYVIAAANALEGDGELVAGATLTVPEVKTSRNDAGTFKPYNPVEITGPTSPGLPYLPPPDKGCGTLGLIIMVVVAVVVTAYTAGAASGAMTAAAQAAGASTAFASSATITMAGITTTTAGVLTTAGSIAAGAIAGAAGAAASLAAGSLMGVASFNWRGVAAGAITGGITGGITAQYGSVADALGSASEMGKASALALANAGGNYAGQKLAGMDAGFSWKSIAASAVSSVMAAKVTPGLAGKMRIHGDFGNDFAHGMVGGMVSAAVRSSFGQTLRRSDYAMVVADAFGNALANATSRNQAAKPAEDTIGQGMQRSLERLQAMSDARSGELAQASLDRMANASMASIAARASTRFQDRLQADFNASLAVETTALANSAMPAGSADGTAYKYGADGRAYASDPAMQNYLSNLVRYADRYSGKDLSGLGHHQKIDYAYQFANGVQNPWSPESVPTNLEGVTVFADGRSVAEHRADRAHARALQDQVAHLAMVDFIRQRNDLGELRSIGDGVLRVVAPIVRNALHNGTLPSAKEYFTGQWKYMGNQAIGLWNLSTHIPSSAGGIARRLGYDPTISEFEYTSGELTAAGIAEAGTFLVGAALGAAKGLGYLDDVARVSPAGYRGAEAIEKWGAVEVPSSAAPARASISPADRDLGFVFRGDGRNPSVIFEEGFQPRGTMDDLYRYANSNEPSIFVGTSKSPNVARLGFASEGDFVYTVRGRSEGLDVNSFLGPESPFPHELEVVFRGGIPSPSILGARQVGANGNFIGPFIWNPAYLPK